MSEKTCCKNMWSSVGRKFMTGITGLLLIGFLVAHLAGNLLLLVGQDAFNHYAHFLEHALHGALIYIAEAGLLAIFLIHIASAAKVQLSKHTARTTRYARSENAGGTSRKSISSMSMIFTGAVLLVFVVLHIIHFKFGPKEMYIAHDGTEMKDLYSLVVHEFHKPLMVILYMTVMVMMGTHLFHGAWSAVQSLGWTRKSTLPYVIVVGSTLAVVLAVGFLLLPLIISFMPDPLASGAANGGAK